MKKVVITGGEGDIAKALAGRLSPNYKVLTPSKEQLNVTDIENVIGYMADHRPDIIINNAGYINPYKIIDEMTPNFMKHFTVNLYGTYLCSKHAILNGCKTIVNIGSSAGEYVKYGWSAYCASKRAVISFTESLAFEGIHSVCISPGRTDTKMRYKLFPDEDKDDLLTVEEFADEAVWIMQHIDRFSGMNLVIKKEDDEVKTFFYRKVKRYV